MIHVRFSSNSIAITMTCNPVIYYLTQYGRLKLIFGFVTQLHNLYSAIKFYRRLSVKYLSLNIPWIKKFDYQESVLRSSLNGRFPCVDIKRLYGSQSTFHNICLTVFRFELNGCISCQYFTEYKNGRTWIGRSEV